MGVYEYSILTNILSLQVLIVRNFESKTKTAPAKNQLTRLKNIGTVGISLQLKPPGAFLGTASPRRHLRLPRCQSTSPIPPTINAINVQTHLQHSQTSNITSQDQKEYFSMETANTSSETYNTSSISLASAPRSSTLLMLGNPVFFWNVPPVEDLLPCTSYSAIPNGLISPASSPFTSLVESCSISKFYYYPNLGVAGKTFEQLIMHSIRHSSPLASPWDSSRTGTRLTSACRKP